MARIILAILAVILPSIYFLYNSSTKGVLEEMIEASQNDDLAAMSARFHWDETRENTKDDLSSKKRALGSYGASIGPPLKQIPDVVDYYIQSENIRLAYHFHDALFPEVTEEEFIRDTGYVFPFGYQITVGYPENYVPKGYTVEPALRQQMRARFIFRLDGLTWKVHEINVPIFMAPHRTYNKPPIEHFAPYLGDAQYR